MWLKGGRYHGIILTEDHSETRRACREAQEHIEATFPVSRGRNKVVWGIEVNGVCYNIENRHDIFDICRSIPARDGVLKDGM